MGLLKNLLTGGANELVKSVGGVIDTLHTSEEEKLQAKGKLMEIEKSFLLKQKEIENEAEKIYQKELETKTKLMIAEISSDDVFVRRVRPIVFLIFTISFVGLQLMFGLATVFNLNINITPEFIDMLDMFKGVFMSFLTIYVGGRSFEKVTRNKKMTTGDMIEKLESLGYKVTKK